MTLNSARSNLHLVFQDEEKGYATKLMPPPLLVDRLKNCQENIRNKLDEVLTENYGVNPKFRVQGSFAYGTCNVPAQPNKGQELDIDYGAYLPVKVFTQDTEGTPNSAEEAKRYIEITRQALQELCDSHNWTLEQKPSCLRIYNVAPHAHIDVPLYAVPDDMFDEMKNQNILVFDSIGKSARPLNERFSTTTIGLESYDTAMFSEITENESLIDLSTVTMIHMAKEDGTWFPSDCEKVREWFKNQCAKYPNNGRQLRFIARYLKGWRDQQWDEKVLLLLY